MGCGGAADPAHPGMLALSDAMPGDVVTGTVRVDNAGPDAYVALQGGSITGVDLLDVTTLTIDGVQAPLWQGGAYQLGKVRSGGHLEVPVTLTVGYDVAEDIWADLSESASLDLDMRAVQAKHTDDPGTGYKP